MDQEPTIAELFPDLTEAEMKIAEENFDRYLALVVRIVERIENEHNPQRRLTPPDGTLRCTAPREQHPP